MASKTDVVVKLVLVFFISLLSFSIGTLVGKKYSDNQHQLAQLEPQKGEKAEREVASVHEGEEGAATAEHGEKKSGTMTDAEIAKLAEEFVADENTPATEAKEGEHAETAAAEHGEHGAEKAEKAETKAVATTAHGKEKAAPATTAKQEPSAMAKELAAGKTPTATEHKAAPATKEARVPSSLPKDVAQYTVGKFTVQVASYADEAEAQKFASDLKDKGYSAFYVPATVKGKTWFRVSVGQFATPKEAASYRTELLSKAKVSSAIVQKITE
ncbi:SPOR domain-containing protein [Bdellovibrio sp. NC01]|uniref:SPOR domain-containing protein n=1 Tax=Bdellovibrio sp. NC01 TaxID=2220073 RepID=UPI001FEDE7B1|nr:SPOR domain-containing protein [Bdellovibrio sp. NC01]